MWHLLTFYSHLKLGVEPKQEGFPVAIAVFTDSKRV